MHLLRSNQDDITRLCQVRFFPQEKTGLPVEDKPERKTGVEVLRIRQGTV